jgi:polar amino acid transport system substrate-binding protein
MRIRRAVMLVFTIVAAALIGVGCGGDGNGNGNGNGAERGDSEIATPEPLEPGGDFVICTDVPYPPAQFQEGQEFRGYEVEMGEEIARRMGVTAVHQKTGFDGIIGALLAGRCDAIISSMNVTPERAEQVSFVEYMLIGQAVAVAPADEGTITSLEDLSGKLVAVQLGTTLGAAIREANRDLDTPIRVRSFPDAGSAASALQNGSVDAFFSDAPVVADYVNKQPTVFAIGGTQIDELPAGIAMRPGDTELIEAVQQAIDDMYADGTIEEIFAEWNVDEFLLERDGEEDEDEDGDGDAGDAATEGRDEDADA